MTGARRLRAGIAGLAVLVVVGTAGYVLIEGANPFDALYMVVITITTVGYGEVFELGGAGRALTVGIMLTGVGLAFYTAAAGIEQLFLLGSTRERSRALKMIAQMKDHVVVCGHGRVGSGVVASLTRRGIDCVVVERDEAQGRRASSEGMAVVVGNATHNDVLESARVQAARALVTCVTDDADNLVVVLSARSLAPDIHIVARAGEAEWEDKLRLAGADRVVLPQRVGSERMAAMAVETTISDVFEVVVGGRAIEFTVEELRVGDRSDVAERSIRDAAVRERSGAIILAIENQARTSLRSPHPEDVLEAGMVVVVVGTQAEVARAEELLA